MKTRAKHSADRSRPDAVRVAWGWLLFLLGVSGLILYVGCNEQTRYEVLSFFFDGVPNPQTGESNIVIGPEGQKWAPDDPRAIAWLAEKKRLDDLKKPGEPVQAVEMVVHPPYRSRQCGQCHGGGLTGMQAQADREMCTKCHVKYALNADDWAHGPFGLGQCGLCHLPHESKHADLLKNPQKELCTNCHVDEGLLDRPYHQKVKSDNALCSTCHDPHMTGNRLMLVDSGSYARRKPESALASSHPPYVERKCNVCHKSEQSNALIENVEKVCLTCHQKVVDSLPAGSHQAVADGKCLSCHNPHTSPRPHLVRATAEKICYSCHTPTQTRKDPHPPVERADCLICHQGHSAGQEHLLRRDVWPVGEWGEVPRVSGAAPAEPEEDENKLEVIKPREGDENSNEGAAP